MNNVVADNTTAGQESGSGTQPMSKAVKVGVVFSPSVLHSFDLSRKEFPLLRQGLALSKCTKNNQEGGGSALGVCTDGADAAVPAAAAVFSLVSLPRQDSAAAAAVSPVSLPRQRAPVFVPIEQVAPIVEQADTDGAFVRSPGSRASSEAVVAEVQRVAAPLSLSVRSPGSTGGGVGSSGAVSSASSLGSPRSGAVSRVPSSEPLGLPRCTVPLPSFPLSMGDGGMKEAHRNVVDFGGIQDGAA